MRQPDDYTEQEAAEIESEIEKLQDMSDTEIFKRWHKERMGHPLGVQLGISAVKELEGDIDLLKAMLEQTVTAIYSAHNELVGMHALLNCASQASELIKELNKTE